MTEVGGLEQANIPRCVERGEGTVVGNPGNDFRWESIARLFRIPKETERPSNVLFEGEFQSINLETRSLLFRLQRVRCYETYIQDGQGTW